MIRYVFTLLLVGLGIPSFAQQTLSFTRISNESGLGLFSNVISSLYQDEKGFIWVGTGNGLQRFDGNKFIDVAVTKPGSDAMPHSLLRNMVSTRDGKLLLAFENYGEIGLFNPADFAYHKVAVELDSTVWPRGEFVMFKAGKEEIFLAVLGTAILHYDTAANRFINDHYFKLPYGVPISGSGIFYDTVKRQLWFAACGGLSIYDESSRQMWHRGYNPKGLAIFNHPDAQDCPNIPYVDKQRRIWLFTWGKRGQQLHCFDSTGSQSLHKDTTGLYAGPMAYTEYRKFLETRSNEMWIYGNNVLYNFDKPVGRFHYNINNASAPNRGITCTMVYQLLEDKDGSVWIGTDNGLFYGDQNATNSAIINLKLDESKSQLSITDILEMPGKELWFTVWTQGVRVLDSNFMEKKIGLYRTPFPKGWTEREKAGAYFTWNMTWQKATGNIIIGCQGGVLLEYNPATETTVYTHPAEFGNSTIRQAIEDSKGTLWFGTQSGTLIKWENKTFSVVRKFKSSLEKFFIDRQGWLWICTSNSGVYAIETTTGKILQRYTKDKDPNSLYLNGGSDIEQLNDSIIVVAAGALNFLNKKTLQIRLMRYEDGLPSNSAVRVRVDKAGFLWIITHNGLCRYNPVNNRFNTYGRKDGIVLANFTTDADYMSSDGDIIFGGGASVVLFKPSVFTTSQAPPDVVITDFKLYNQNLPVDSLMQHSEVKLGTEQNSLSIYFSSLSYAQKDRLTYYYKMEGIDKNWSMADQSNYKSYSLLPPGRYVFKVYSETIDGQQSPHITEMHLYIKPPFWATKWFLCSVLLITALIIYTIHHARISKLLAMEKLRNRVARDLHDDMGSTLSTINILSAMAKTKMATDTIKTSEYLSKISDNSQRMMEAMDDIVWSIKPSNDSLQKITARMREFATNVLEAKDMELDFKVEDTVCEVKLNMEARRDFFLVFKEAVNNAAKYSKAGKVWVQVGCSRKKLWLSVKDNGIGFTPKEADGGNGLSNMQKRADAMNGTIRITSAPDQGTQVMVSIPVG